MNVLLEEVNSKLTAAFEGISTAKEEVLCKMGEMHRDLGGRISNLEVIAEHHSVTLKEHSAILKEHSTILKEHSTDLATIKGDVNELTRDRFDLVDVKRRVTALEAVRS